MQAYDALLVLSFGGPEGMDDVLPFLDNVLRGRNVPDERKREVALHYARFGGVSPINAQNRSLVSCLGEALRVAGHTLPVYLGNRNWHPYLIDTLRAMQRDGIRRSLAFVTSAFGSYSGCRQYSEDIERSRLALGAEAPEISRLRSFFNHPLFVEACAERLAEACRRSEERTPHVIFTAHSIPTAMTHASPYVERLREAARLTAELAGCPKWDLVWQSRSGPPSQSWLEPDVGDHLEGLAARGVRSAVVAPIGFLSDHLEVIWDLDTALQERAQTLGVRVERAATVGTHPSFVSMVVELVGERLADAPRRAVGVFPAAPDACLAGCCPAPVRPPARPA
jgi:ferrochelatase